MDIAFDCPRCRQHLVVDDAGAGMSVPCPKCGKEITIPVISPSQPKINNALRECVAAILAGSLGPNAARQKIKKFAKSEGLPQPSDDLLDLVISTNVHTAQGYGMRKQAMETQHIGFPGWELYRIGTRLAPRDWAQRWKAAAEASGDNDAARAFKNTGRMVALKSSPIWQALGNGVGGFESDALGNDYPPFAFNSGMGVKSVSYSECVDLGLMDESEDVKPRKVAPPTFFLIEDPRLTEYLGNLPELCDHCGTERPRNILNTCDVCGKFICPVCNAEGCTLDEQ